jgi:hypothetical protein
MGRGAAVRSNPAPAGSVRLSSEMPIKPSSVFGKQVCRKELHYSLLFKQRAALFAVV